MLMWKHSVEIVRSMPVAPLFLQYSVTPSAQLRISHVDFRVIIGTGGMPLPYFVIVIYV